MSTHWRHRLCDIKSFKTPVLHSFETRVFFMFFSFRRAKIYWLCTAFQTAITFFSRDILILKKSFICFGARAGIGIWTVAPIFTRENKREENFSEGSIFFWAEKGPRSGCRPSFRIYSFLVRAVRRFFGPRRDQGLGAVRNNCRRHGAIRDSWLLFVNFDTVLESTLTNFNPWLAEYVIGSPRVEIGHCWLWHGVKNWKI